MTKSIQSVDALLVALPLLSSLSIDARQAFVQEAQIRVVEADGFVFAQGDACTHFYLLISGLVKVVRHTANGNQLLVRFVLPGDVMGISPLLNRDVYPASACSVNQSVSLAWPVAQWQSLTQRYPFLLERSQATVIKRLADADDRLIELHSLPVEKRLAHSLIRLVEQAGCNQEDGMSLSIPLTRQDLAELAGTTLYTASRTLSAWDGQGLIHAGRMQVQIPDLKKFAEHVLADA